NVRLALKSNRASPPTATRASHFRQASATVRSKVTPFQLVDAATPNCVRVRRALLWFSLRSSFADLNRQPIRQTFSASKADAPESSPFQSAIKPTHLSRLRRAPAPKARE